MLFFIFVTLYTVNQYIMLDYKPLRKLLAILLLTPLAGFSQLDFSHEIGVFAGPAALQSDYGQRHDFDTNLGNVGIGIGVIHYMNFSYKAECSCYTTYNYFNDHFRVRNEISLVYTKLKHYGEWVQPYRTSETADQLRAMRNTTTVFNIGSQLEYYPLSIREYESGGYSFAPYISLGGQFNAFTPQNTSTRGRLDDPGVLPDKYSNGAVTNDSGSTFSIVSNIGTRYKLSRTADLFFDLRWQYYFSNWVEGVSPDEDLYPENKANDWTFWVSVGYIFYIQ